MRLSELSARDLDNKHASSPSPDTYKQLLILRSEYNTLSTSQAEEALLKSRCRYYDIGDKANKILAYQLRQSVTTHFIPQIKTVEGVTTDPSKINAEFKHFYSTLYEPDTVTDSAQLNSFFDKLHVPTLTSEQQELLECPLTVKELTTAMTAMQCGKCPGPDGFPLEFYRKFSSKIIPLLLKMLNTSLTLGQLPHTLRQATITLILKKK